MALDKDQTRQLLDRYTNGENVRALASSLSISVQTLYNIVKQSGLPPRSERRRSAATLEVIQACRHGAVVEHAAASAGISTSTASRLLRQYRTNGGTLDVKRGRPDYRHIAIPTLEEIETDPALLDAISKRLARSPFPYPQPLAPDIAAKELQKIKSITTQLDETSTIRPWCPFGTRICAPYFPNRYVAISHKQCSALDAWRTPSKLARAIRFQLRRGDSTASAHLLRAITMQCRTPTIFKPTVARFIYERYCPPDGIVWDPCSGYGGRLLGAIAAGVQYIGTDVEPLTIEGNMRLAKSLDYAAALHCVPAETFDPPKVNLVFTSPPYFDRERYSQAVAQSWHQYRTLNDWTAGFLRPVIERAYHALSDGHLVLNIADLKTHDGILPLVEHTLGAALAAGFVHTETLRMPLAAVNRQAPTEPVLVFKK